jgi:hypothetical protein
MLGGLCLLDSITLLVTLEHVEWSLPDITYNFTPQNLSMLGGLCLLDSITLLVALEQVKWSLPDITYNFTHSQGVKLCDLTGKDHPTYISPWSKAIRYKKQRPPYILKFWGVKL